MKDQVSRVKEAPSVAGFLTAATPPPPPHNRTQLHHPSKALHSTRQRGQT